ncbi:PocR ligand-binding domain-containing protein [Wukongibacter sp. M2B1]|uniref:sensor histidine kinase n=1 Tax=Wukongibacter sp. M2B1 TaxID=3088895 RepID=UPI003D7BD5A7
MRYKLGDLIDIEKFRKLMEEFYRITKIPHGLLDTEGNILSCIGWQDICKKFYREYGESALRYKESDLKTWTGSYVGGKFYIYKCKNGLMEAVVPIIVEDKYMGSLCLGQFLFEKPDIEFFRKQAEKLEYNQESYIEAISLIPVLTMEKVEAAMTYFSRLADMLSNMGLNQLKNKEVDNLLIKANEKLEERVAERTEKLAIANKRLKRYIRKRKLIELRLKRSEERYRKLVEIMPDAIIVYNKQKIIFTNPAFAKLVGIDNHEELIGRSLFDFVYPKDRRKVIECIKDIVKGKKIPLVEHRLIGVDGKIADTEATGTLFPYGGKNAILAVGRDISKRKNVERMQKKIEEEKRFLNEAREYEKLKTEFFANLSHEFRTPLNLIYSTIQLFEQDLKNRVAVEDRYYMNKRIKVLKQNAHRILRLCNNLLDITKIDAGYFELELENINIVNVIENITISVARYVERKNIKVIFDTDIEELIIAIDVNIVERIMLNLLSNAVKFTKQGGKVVVKLSNTENDVYISVKDTGIGIPEDKIKIIFDRFRQVNKSIRRNHEGSGIGLSLVKLLMDLHNGEIQVKSKYGTGSEFILKFPRERIDNDERISNFSRPLELIENNTKAIEVEFSDIYGLDK